MKAIFQSQKASATAFAVCALILIGFMGACYYTFPSFDDFSYSKSTLSAGFWNSQVIHYMDWGGRYTSNFIMAVICSLDPQWKLYGFWAFSLVLMYLSSIWFLLKVLVPTAPKTQKLAIYVISAVVMLGAMPSIVQLFYWITGAVYYSLGIFTTFLGLGILILREKKPSLFLDFLLLFITVFNTGNNELSLIGWQELLLSLILLKYLKTKTWDKTLIVLLVIGTITGLIALLAPGNFVRQAQFEKSGQIVRTVSNGLLHYFLFSIKLLSPALVILLIRFRKELIGLVDPYLKDADRCLVKKLIWTHWFLFLFSTAALAFWAMGRKPNTRSLNVIMVYYWIMLPFILWLFKDLEVKPLVVKVRSFIDTYWAPLFIVALIASFNVRTLIKDYALNFHQYREVWATNMERLKNGAGQDIVLLPPPRKADTTYFSDFSSDRDLGRLKSIYGFNSLIIQTKESQK